MMDNLWKSYSEDRRIRVEDEHLSLNGLNIDAHDVKPGNIIYKKNSVAVTVFEVDHGDHVKPAYGYKISYKGRSVVISGDTRYSKNVENAARGADLLIHEVAMIPMLLKIIPAFKAIYEHHITPEIAGKLFANTRPKLVVYTHVITAGGKGIVKTPAAEDILTATRKTYKGKVVVGEDLMSFEITGTGVKIIYHSGK